MPELELGQSSDKRSEFIVLLCGKPRALAILQSFILRQTGVEFRLQECEEQVQQVNAETVCDNVPALRDDDAQEEQDKERSGCRPSVGDKWGRLVKVGLILLWQI